MIHNVTTIMLRTASLILLNGSDSMVAHSDNLKLAMFFYYEM